jgi:hypothetical protein
MSNRADSFLSIMGDYEQSFNPVPDDDSMRNENLDGYQDEPEVDYKLLASELDDLEFGEGLVVTPVGFSNGAYYVTVNEETLSFNCSKEAAQKFEKLVTFSTGAKALDWLKNNSVKA